MKRIPLKMVRANTLEIPQYALPAGFTIKPYVPGDEQHWARIETSVGEFKNEEAALERFQKEFAPYKDEMEKRCLFIENDQGEYIATTTAWYGDLKGDGEISGRIHWVGVDPRYQGKKLAKPLLSAAMNILAQIHSKAYLTSQTTSYQAINMYLNYGFKPYLTEESCEEAWSLMESTLDRVIPHK
ncbi:GNAT family N-acetyltransferase [Alkalicoccobacillus porphyridii]|uniref:GNAT family N-acetyltransferase n=1 Tax=Alkalicoccobacillus porphyridii TaxID=2597270 RepID=A0A554A0U5_9BACI|nr:GNAT family N-acetyltransferase [Alkalicoccobacillus porphyridii]TSB47314.1 GNAT family N-acetyltransferase [Alkalicoccobacillus porphyridii]